MSTVVLDTITGKSTSTTITIGSTPVVSASANSMTIRGEGSAQTSIQQGLSKAWANVSGVNTTVNDSFNVASSTDVSTGKKDIGFTNNMSNALYSTVAMVFFNTGTGNGMNTAVEATYSTSEFRLITITHLNDSTSTADSQAIFTQVSGDLA
jgi:hypothetical protein